MSSFGAQMCIIRERLNTAHEPRMFGITCKAERRRIKSIKASVGIRNGMVGIYGVGTRVLRNKEIPEKVKNSE